MTHRILKLFRWQFHWTTPLWKSNPIVWRKDGYNGVTIHKLWGYGLFGDRYLAQLTHLGYSLAEGYCSRPFNTFCPHANMRTAQFHLRTSAPIAFVSFSWWKEESP